MKMKKFPKLILAGLFLGLVGQVSSEELSRARIKSKEIMDGRATDIFVAGADQKAVLYKTGVQEIDNRKIPVSSVDILYYYVPSEYLEANTNFQDGHYKEAKARFKGVAEKYKAVLNSPGNYALKALHMELESAVYMLDWAEVKTLEKKFASHKPVFERSMANDLEIYELLGKFSDRKYDDVIASAKAMLVDKKKWTLKQRGRISYALGAALEAKGGNAVEALNCYAVTLAAYHGGGASIAESAILKSMDILAADKAVEDFMKTAPENIGVEAKKALPAKLQELAGLAYMYKNVMFPEKKLNDKYIQYLRFHLSGSEKLASSEVNAEAEETKKEGKENKKDEKTPSK